MTSNLILYNTVNSLIPCIWNIAEFALDMYAKVQLCFVIADGEYCSHLPRLEQGCA